MRSEDLLVLETVIGPGVIAVMPNEGLAACEDAHV